MVQAHVPLSQWILLTKHKFKGKIIKKFKKAMQNLKLHTQVLLRQGALCSSTLLMPMKPALPFLLRKGAACPHSVGLEWWPTTDSVVLCVLGFKDTEILSNKLLLGKSNPGK